ncbi:MAG TPA: hypothetical protein VEA59_07125 [Patescibacteria group bacterium]|nr:hypothetical protein [Patescibacteria group bacterium]
MERMFFVLILIYWLIATSAVAWQQKRFGQLDWAWKMLHIIAVGLGCIWIGWLAGLAGYRLVADYQFVNTVVAVACGAIGGYVLTDWLAFRIK